MMVYETKRLFLRQLDESFANQVLNYYQKNRDFLTEWEAEKPENFYTLEFQKKKLLQDKKSYKKGESFKLWMFKKEDIDYSTIIGCMSFSLIVRGNFQSCILGYKLDKDELNKGYMTEALQKAIEIMFFEFGLHRIEAPIMPRNEASIKVVKKLGFEYEGLSRKMLQVNGVWEDHMRWVLINE